MARPSSLPFDVSDLELTQRETQFISHYSINLNALAAYRAARFVDKTVSDAEANTKALQLLNKPSIREGVRRVGASMLEPVRDALYVKTMRFLEQRAFFNVKDFFYESGKPKPLSEIPEEALAAIDQIVEDFKGKDGDVRVVKFTLANRMEAIKKIQEFLKDTAPVKEEKKGGLTESHMDELSSIFSRLSAQNAAESAITGFRAGLAAKEDKKGPVPAEDQHTIEMTPEQIVDQIAPGVDVQSGTRKELPEPLPRNVPEFLTRRARVVRERTLKAADEV